MQQIELSCDENPQSETHQTPPTNTVRVTFLPENKTVEFEHGKLPYQDHGKPQSLLDVAMNSASISSTPAAATAPAPPATSW